MQYNCGDVKIYTFSSFCLFLMFFIHICEKFIFQPAFRVCSTQTLVKIYNRYFWSCWVTVKLQISHNSLSTKNNFLFKFWKFDCFKVSVAYCRKPNTCWLACKWDKGFQSLVWDILIEKASLSSIAHQVLQILYSSSGYQSPAEVDKLFISFWMIIN